MANRKFSALTEKTTIVAADAIPGVDSETGPVSSKKFLFSTISNAVLTTIHALTGKTTPVDADEFGIIDTGASNVPKKLTVANLRAKLFNTDIHALTGKTTPVSADEFPLVDSAASNVLKKLLYSDLITALNLIYAPIGVTITSPVAWTPTFTGFGTVSAVNAKSWRVGSELFFEVTFTAGTNTATEARMSLGFNGTDGNVTSASNYPTLQIIEYGGFSSNTNNVVLMIEASKTYIVFGRQISGSSAALVKRNGNVFDNADTFSFKGSIRNSAW